MQTFLPLPDFQKSAACLDMRRLGKQRLEALQILKAIFDPSYGWQNHPAVNQWRGYVSALENYLFFIEDEWKTRGYKSSLSGITFNKGIFYPLWLGYPPYHASHRAALLAKDYEWYSKFDWKETPEINYVWPSKIKEFKCTQ